MSDFQQYLDLGWALCKIEPGTKGPNHSGWNRKENALKSLDGVQGAGLMHAYSGTCAIDIDDWDEAEKVLQEHGIDLTALFMAPDAVTISSGTPGRAKLLFKLDTPMPTIKLGENKKLELRCASANGMSVQDVLPPSIHPSGRKYTMTGDPAKMPEIPHKLALLWQRNITPSGNITAPEVAKNEESDRAVTLARLKKVIDKKNPDIPHDDWLEIGMALHHESGGSDEGLKIWDEWSAKGSKYLGYEHIANRYHSFGGSARPVTGARFLHEEVSSVDDFEVINKADVVVFEAPKKVNPFKGKHLTREQWEKIPEPVWFLPGVLHENGVACMFGPSGTCKSFAAINIAVAASTGGLWRGHRLKPGAVATIAAEDALGFRMRLSAALNERGVYSPNVTVLEGDPMLQDEEQMNWMIESIKEDVGNLSLVIVDTLAAATPGMDENSSQEVTVLMAYCRRLQRELGCAVLLIHHTGKDASKGSRGSSAYKAGFDAQYETEGKGVLHGFKLDKVRNGPDTDEFGNPIKFSYTTRNVEKTLFVEWI